MVRPCDDNAPEKIVKASLAGKQPRILLFGIGEGEANITCLAIWDILDTCPNQRSWNLSIRNSGIQDFRI